MGGDKGDSYRQFLQRRDSLLNMFIGARAGRENGPKEKLRRWLYFISAFFMIPCGCLGMILFFPLLLNEGHLPWDFWALRFHMAVGGSGD